MMSYSEAFLPENIKTSYDNLVDHYVRKQPNKNAVYNGHPLFGKLNDKNLEEDEQKLLMTIVLDAYNRILTQMEIEAQDEKVKHELQEVKEQMNRLKKHYFAGKHADIKKYVTELLALKKYLHSCVLQKILDFYENVLLNDQYIQNYDLDLISTLDTVRNCTYKVKRCGMLYQMANTRPDLKIAEEDMSAQEVAIYQLQKLNYASERISEKPPPPVTSGKQTADEAYDKQRTE
ncbi:interferon gamma [Clarias magur]|uniref:Interferon gamma n=1 Tax=Clarias magur TaxID=1594786 RepID=A0A8J4UWI6_CLAMG|nr:interferon gamma [Clarias magur]